MKNHHVYNSKNIIILVVIFIIIFSLLYSLTSFIKESQNLNNEIAIIREINLKTEEAIKEKEKILLYLQTNERIDKEAKIQIGKKQVGESSLIFTGNTESISDKNETKEIKSANQPISNFQKWLNIFN